MERHVRRGDLPPYTFHILKITPTSRSRTHTEVGAPGAPLAIHWVRGHFKAYTAEQPLFGQHTGLYWWHPHLAGQARERRIEKAYNLVGGGHGP